MSDKQIPIRCSGSRTIEWTELVPFQGDLKEMSKDSFQKLRASILKYGWISPIFVWKDTLLADGHGRILVLKELIKEGYTIEPLPICDIQAIDKREAAEILLAINSKFQNVTPEGLYEYVTNFDIDLDTLQNFELPDIDFDIFKAEFYDKDAPPDAEPENNKPEDTKLSTCPSCGVTWEK